MRILKRIARIWKFITTPEEDTPENRAKWESRAPGWIIRCPECGWQDHFGRYGIRKGGAGKPCNYGKCPGCGKWSWMVIEKGDSSR